MRTYSYYMQSLSDPCLVDSKLLVNIVGCIPLGTTSPTHEECALQISLNITYICTSHTCRMYLQYSCVRWKWLTERALLKSSASWSPNLLPERSKCLISTLSPITLLNIWAPGRPSELLAISCTSNISSERYKACDWLSPKSVTEERESRYQVVIHLKVSKWKVLHIIFAKNKRGK